MRIITAVLSLLCLSASVWSADPTIDGPTSVAQYKLVRLQAGNLPAKSGVLWSVYPPGQADLARGCDKKCLEFVAPPGTYVVELLVITIDENGIPIPSKIQTNVVIQDKPGPGPVPPGPTPDPNPPGPTPNPPPIPTAGFRVLMIYETSQVSKLPPEQSAILFSGDVRDYLNSHCVVGPDGKMKEWRIWDKDIDTTNASKLWQDAMKLPRSSVPWIIISDGKTGFSGPLPPNRAETLDLLKKYGGN